MMFQVSLEAFLEKNNIGPEYNNEKQHSVSMGPKNTWKKVQFIEVRQHVDFSWEGCRDM